MNLDQIKKQLNESKKKEKKSEAKKDVSYNPAVGKQVIHVVPNKYDPDGQFQPLRIYYNIGGAKVMASPANWGEKDPIEEFVKKLKASNNKENWLLSRKLEAKTRYYTPVIVRGEEDEVKLWNFGVKLYQEFLNLADDEEVGDYTDVNEGRDIKVTTVGKDQTGTDYNATTISPAMKSSPLSTDKKMIKKFLEEQPNPLDQFKRFTFEEVKENLRKFITPEEEESEIEEDSTDSTMDMPKSNYNKQVKVVDKVTPPSQKANKFDSMFEEEEESADDLPF